MNFRWRAIGQAPVWPLSIIETEVVPQPGPQVRHNGIVLEVDFLVLDAAPQTFNKDIAPEASESS
jgi:hypothetical protein